MPVFVPQSEIDLLTGKLKRTAMWLPLVRGPHNQVQPCPVELGQCVRLQAQVGQKSVAITVTETPTLTTLGLLTDTDARQQGHRHIQAARTAWERSYGPWRDEVACWVVRFVLGDRSGFYRQHQEQFLKAKMGGGRSLTTVPEQGVRGEGAVPDADLAGFAAKARATREEEGRLRLQNALTQIRQAIAETKDIELTSEAKADLDWMRRRAVRLEKKLMEDKAAA